MADFSVFSSDLGFIEGPVWAGNSLFLVSINRGCVFELDTSGRQRAVFATGGGPNGLTHDGKRLLVAQNGGIFGASGPAAAGVQVIENSQVTAAFPGVFNAPNDLCFGPDGRLYVTDPASEKGILEPIEGRVLACDLDTGATEVICEGRHFPNGLAFDASGDHLFLALTYSRVIERFAFEAGRLRSVGTFCQMHNGRPDGMALDVEGNLWICTPGTGGLEVFGPDGHFLERFAFGEGSMTTNCCFGGADRRDLFITAAGLGSVLIMRAPYPGLQLRGAA